MVYFYNITGILFCICALLMFRTSRATGADQPEFLTASRILIIIYLLTGLSMFTAQLEPQLDSGEFEILHPVMLLFFYLAAQGFIYTVLLLHRSPYAGEGYLRRAVTPILSLFGAYALLYMLLGDVRVYTARDFFDMLPHEPMLIFRCTLFAALAFSILRGMLLCHKVHHESQNQILEHLTEAGYLRLVGISRLIWSIEALAVWVTLTYFYTTPVLEIISVTLMLLVFALQIQAFRKYASLYKSAGLITSATDDEQETILGQRLNRWATRDDKPYTRSSLTIGDVARDIQVSKNRLSAYINGQELTFRSWINGLRIEESRKMLESRADISISEIAEQTGFCDLPAFSRAFKKAYGQAPKSFRNNLSTRSPQHSPE